MRVLLTGVLAAVLASPVTAAVRAVIPNCCVGTSFIDVLDPATGAVEASVSTGALSNNGSSAGVGFILTKDGQGAVVQTLTYSYFPTGAAYVLTVVDLLTGKVSGTLPVPADGYSLAVNPKSGVVYASYQGAGGTHIQEIDPIHVTIVRDVTVGDFGGTFPPGLVVSPDGDTIYLATQNGPVVVQASTLQQTGSVSIPCTGAMILSPNGATLYVETCGTTDIDFVDTATLQVTQAVPFTGDFWSFAISPDGAQIYLAAGVSLLTLDVKTLALSAAALPVYAGQIAVSPNGTVYVGAPQEYDDYGQISVFDPATQAVVNTYNTSGPGDFAVGANGSFLYYYGFQTVPVAMTGTAPSTTIARTGISGWGTGAGAYDPKDNLVLSPDGWSNVNILDGDTLRTKASLNVPGLNGRVLFANDLAYAMLGNGIASFDPVALTVGQSVPIPCLDTSGGTYGQPAQSGNFIYLPVSNLYGPVCAGIAVFDTQRNALAALWPFRKPPALAVAPGSLVGYAIVYPVSSQTADLKEIDLKTGKTLRHVHLQSRSGPMLAISPDGSTLYVTLNKTVHRIGTQNLNIVDASPVQVRNFLNVTPDGQYIYSFSDSYNPPAVVILSASLQVVGTIPDTVFTTSMFFAGQ
jgi:hypothetical protein